MVFGIKTYGIPKRPDAVGPRRKKLIRGPLPMKVKKRKPIKTLPVKRKPIKTLLVKKKKNNK